MILDHDVIGVG